MQNKLEMLEDEENVSYDVISIFTNIPLNETINFICDEIYIGERFQPIYKGSIFKKLFLKLTTEYAFSINGQLWKQINGISMGDALSAVLSDCFMNKMERDVVILLKPKFYKRFVDDIYRQRKEMNQMNYLIR